MGWVARPAHRRLAGRAVPPERHDFARNVLRSQSHYSETRHAPPSSPTMRDPGDEDFIATLGTYNVAMTQRW